MPKIERQSVQAQNKKKVITVREMTKGANKVHKLQSHAGCKLKSGHRKIWQAQQTNTIYKKINQKMNVCLCV